VMEFEQLLEKTLRGFRKSLVGSVVDSVHEPKTLLNRPDRRPMGTAGTLLSAGGSSR
jgi:hypothetical protein